MQQVRRYEGEREGWEVGDTPEGEGGDSKYNEYTEPHTSLHLSSFLSV